MSIDREPHAPPNAKRDEALAFDWKSDQAPYSHAYLSGPVLALLSDLGARRVLDVGAGNGRLAARIAEAGMHVVGIEYNPEGVAIARRAYPDIAFHARGVQDDASDIVREEGMFDTVVSTEVIEHLYDPSQLLSFASQFLEPGGRLIVSTPYHGYWKNLALSVAGKWDFHHHPRKVGGHVKFWSRKQLALLMEENGFVVDRFVGAGRFPYLWKSMIMTAHRV